MFNFSPRFKKAALLLTLILVIIPMSPVFGDFFQWSVLGNILFFTADNGASADPFPILPSGGASVSLQIWGPLRAELTEDIYIANYEYNSDLNRPMSSSQDNRSALVIGFFTAVQITGNFSLNDKGTALRVFAGAAADLRAVVLAAGLNHPDDLSGNITTNAQLQTDAIRDYFWSEGRWLMPVAGVGMDFPISEYFLIGFDLRVWFPAYKINSKEDLPAIDGWRFGAGLRITPRGKQ
ncbi:MAG: hypothetical protein FWB77_04560 [Treponema sp.]|nr:hypothetical protein [Treponema sp.]